MVEATANAALRHGKAVKSLSDKPYASSSHEVVNGVEGQQMYTLMYLVDISQACGGGTDYLVLNNIVQYASAD
ncbi:LOW QUALITY PROTEIN: hypothetical protein PHMEG_00015355 [Phytophthora megakarya]|uniref:Uncharacterized protein n=1 Tax=Phytophthora megakarya TaxID=4795 RepID=A0A225W219_9STRA|nr:LOW QUALITY PROTEIN: hypothetical protein PHMEG_00015355 [Phytophthora megakarya]